MRLTNGILALDFDDRNGSLVQIEDLKAGVKHLDNPDGGRLFRLFVPDEERWHDRYCDSHESGRPEFVSQDGALEIRFASLRAPNGDVLPIRATMRVALPAGADEALFTMHIENQGPRMIYEAIFPWVTGWKGYGNGNLGSLRCGSTQPVNLAHLRWGAGWNLIGVCRRRNFGYPHVHAPMCDISGGPHGMSFNLYPIRQDRNWDLSVFDLAAYKYDAPAPSWAWTQRPFIAAGASWTSEPVGVGCHTGDWHATADRMRRWLQTWWKAPYAPKRLRHAIGYHNAYATDFAGRDWRKLSDLPAIAKCGLEHGMDHFIIWDVPFLGVYAKPGRSGLFAMPPERRQELGGALDEMRRMGVETNTLINLRLVEKKNDLYREFGEERVVRSVYGMPAAESFPWRGNAGNRWTTYLESCGTRLCQANPAFQDWAVQQIATTLDHGFGTAFLDQPFGEDYCFATNHGHRPGEPTNAGALAWVARAREVIQKRNPDAWILGEVPDIWNTQECNVWWHWDWNDLCPEVFRYLLPESIQSWTIDAYQHEHEVGRAFALGHLLNINVRGLELALPDVPAFATRVKQLAALRTKTAAFTMEARFMDRLGMKVEGGGNAVHAYRYQAGDTCAIVLGECSQSLNDGGGKVRVELDDCTLTGAVPSRAKCFRQDGSECELPVERSGAGCAVELSLGRWECAVVKI